MKDDQGNCRTTDTSGSPVLEVLLYLYTIETLQSFPWYPDSLLISMKFKYGEKTKKAISLKVLENQAQCNIFPLYYFVSNNLQEI
jgi:hypothetical protein